MNDLQIFPPCFINGVWTTNQTLLREHYRKVNKAQAAGHENPFANFEASGDLMAETIQYLDKKRKREELQQSTEFGQLLKNDPAELRRIMKEDPDRYDSMTRLHSITLTASK